ncbi:MULTISPECIES: DUF1700 domain-containing protein [unclassified Paenibacillus]|uniref:DUF1700 domain-containing protein n=1 Tax=unclassified Paenibacillus TaxID=185978 RepID=UPI0009570C3C|nr:MULTISPECIES: DUF1700 domain-containing protein [unclassified Paenibacillus]ASS64724.1 DUF1700 domain-containing protein [Paenibacillus sp. RUD330]SIR09331.1 Protein of unknown function [Paenibacillus sp. RU4X]SIR27258.1 Protein of unknown function [Paenibacillus sp. RU4T]
MSPQGRAYLERFHHLLNGIPDEEKLDAVREIESHIAEGIAHGRQESEVLARLGDPRKLARAYRSEYIIGRSSSPSLRNMLVMARFYCTTGLLSIMVIPVLATVAYGFAFCAALALLAGIIRSFGQTWISMTVYPGVEVPTEWSMAYAVVLAGITGSIAYVSRKYLRKYMLFLSASYRKILPETAPHSHYGA